MAFFTRFSLLLPTVGGVETGAAMQDPKANLPQTSLLSAFLTLSILGIVAWGGVRVAPRYLNCALNGEFSHSGTVCAYDTQRTTAQGFGSRVREYSFLLRL